MSEAEEDDIHSVPQKRRPLLKVLAGCALIIICLASLAAVIFIIDPFGLHLSDLLTGTRDRAALAMPVDTTFYVGANLQELTSAETARLTAVFLEAIADPGVADIDGALEQLDRELEAELGISIQEDVRPWLGRDLGLGITGIELDANGELSSFDWILAAETRNKSDSHQFLADLRAGLISNTDAALGESMYQDVAIYETGEVDVLGTLEGIAFAQSGDKVLLGSSSEAVRSAIEAQNGDSLGDTSHFGNLMDALQNGRLFTVYADGENVQELLDESTFEIPYGLDLASLPAVGFEKSALGFTVVEAGLQLDLVRQKKNNEGGGDRKTSNQTFSGSNEIETLLPADTLVYLFGGRLDQTWANFLDDLDNRGQLADFEESMALLSREFGIDPNTDLFPRLDGQWGLGLLAGSSGLITDELGLPFGLALHASTTRPSSLEESLQIFSDALVDRQRLTVGAAPKELFPGNYVSLDANSDPFLVYGLADKNLFIASDQETASRLFGDESSLARSAGFLNSISELPDGLNPSLYVNVNTLLDALAENMPSDERDNFEDQLRILRPLTFIAAGTDPNPGDVERTTAVFLIN